MSVTVLVLQVKTNSNITEDGKLIQRSCICCRAPFYLPYNLTGSSHLCRHVHQQHRGHRSLGLAVALIGPVHGVGLQDPVKILLPAGRKASQLPKSQTQEPLMWKLPICRLIQMITDYKWSHVLKCPLFFSILLPVVKLCRKPCDVYVLIFKHICLWWKTVGVDLPMTTTGSKHLMEGELPVKILLYNVQPFSLTRLSFQLLQLKKKF